MEGKRFSFLLLAAALAIFAASCGVEAGRTDLPSVLGAAGGIYGGYSSYRSTDLLFSAYATFMIFTFSDSNEFRNPNATND